MSYQDSAFRAWLEDTSPAKLGEAAEFVAGMSDVIAVYQRAGDRYRWSHSAPRRSMSRAEWTGYRGHGHELVDTQAASHGPDVVGLLRDDVSYGVAGDHGGHQRAAQDVPIGLCGAGTAAVPSAAPMRSVDITPSVLRVLGIGSAYPHDGIAHPIPGHLGWR